METSKSLKFMFSADEPSARRVINLIREIKKEAEDLVAVLNRGGGGMGGLFGGASTHVGGPGSQYSAGARSIGGGVPTPAQRGGGGLAGGLTRTLLDSKNLLKGVASESKDAARIMKDAIKDSISKQTTEIGRLRAQIKGLTEDYKRLDSAESAIKNGGGDFVGERLSLLGTERSGVQTRTVDAQNRLNKAQADLKNLQGKQGVFATLLSGGSVDLNLKKMLGIGVAGYVGYRALSGYANQAQITPTLFQANQATLGSTWGNAALKTMMGHNLAFTMAYMHMVRGEQDENVPFYKQYEKDATKAAAKANQHVSRSDSFFHRKNNADARAAYVKIATDAVKDKFLSDHPTAGIFDRIASSSWTDWFHAIGALPSLNSGEIVKSFSQAYSGIPTLQRMFSAIPQYMQAHPIDTAAYQQFAQTAASEAGVMRALGISSRGKGGSYSTRVKDLEAALTGRGLGTGDLIAGLQSIVSTGGYGTAQALKYTAMNANIGQVQGVGGLIGSGAQYGLSNPALQILAHQLAGVGIDRQAQSLLANSLAQNTLNGGALTNPGNLMAAMSMFAGQGTSAGNQMRIMAGETRGLQAVNANIFGGGADNLQKARNYVNALAVTGNNNLFGTNYLAEKFNMGMLTDAQHGKVAPELAARGITADMVQAYGDRTFSTLFRNMGLGNSNTPEGKLYRSMMAGGFGSNFGKYIKANHIHGKELEKLFPIFGAMLEDEGLVGQGQTGEGLARIMAGSQYTRKLRKGHFHDPFAGTNEEAVQKQEEKGQKLLNQKMKDITKSFIDAQGTIASTFHDIGAEMDTSVDSVAKKLNTLALNIDKINKHFEQEFGGAGKRATAGAAKP